MIRFWIEFENPPQSMLGLGCGVTARSEADAIEILHERVPQSRLLKIRRVIGGVALSDLDQGRVVPNMGVWIRRGVWFPQGFD